jgi:hypothetical protein
MERRWCRGERKDDIRRGELNDYDHDEYFGLPTIMCQPTKALSEEITGMRSRSCR